MMELLSTYLEPILTFVAGGGLVSVFTMKWTKKTAEANAMKAVQEVYQNTIKDMQEDKQNIKTDNKELRDQIGELQKTVVEHSKAIDDLKTYKCVVIDCEKRKRN